VVVVKALTVVVASSTITLPLRLIRTLRCGDCTAFCTYAAMPLFSALALPPESNFSSPRISKGDPVSPCRRPAIFTPPGTADAAATVNPAPVKSKPAMYSQRSFVENSLRHSCHGR